MNAFEALAQTAREGRPDLKIETIDLEPSYVGICVKRPDRERRFAQRWLTSEMQTQEQFDSGVTLLVTRAEPFS